MIWRSPLRSKRFTAQLGLVLLIGLPVLLITGLLSYAAYNPDLGGGNDRTPDKGVLGFFLFDWPTNPAGLYQVTQGTHVILGIALIPVLLAKLWSVIPALFAWPPVRSLGHAIERSSLVMLVGGGVFVFATGVLNIQQWYVFPVGFYRAHFYGAWIFVAGLVIHLVVHFGSMVSALRNRLAAEPAGRRPAGRTHDERPDGDQPRPSQGTVSRRGALASVTASSALLVLLTVGQSTGGWLRELALLAPRGRGEQFPVNRTAEQAAVPTELTGTDWRLELHGASTVQLRRSELLAMPQHTERITLACVEGWSTTRIWSGVRLRDLAELAGVPEPTDVLIRSLQQRGSFASAHLRGNQILDPRSLLALRVDDEELSLDHGFPARIIVPNNPGVHNTKWVASMSFTAIDDAARPEPGRNGDGA